MRRFVLSTLGLLCALVSSLRASDHADTGAFEGVWLGRVTAPNASTEIGFAFTKTDQGFLLRFHMPAMFAHDATLGPARVEGDVLRFPPLDTVLRREGDRLVGTFGLANLPVELRRGGTFSAAPARVAHPAGPAARWSVTLGAETWASPVAHEGVTYLGTADGKLHARDTATGRERWTWSGPNAIYGSAFVDGERVCFVDERVDLVCLDRATGALRWRTPLHDAARAGGPAPKNPTFNRRTPTPVLHNGALLVGSTDQGLYAIDARTGAIRWRHETGTRIFASVGLDGDLAWLGGHDGAVIALDLRTRTETARTKLPGAVVSMPRRVGETVIVGCRDYMLYGLKRPDLTPAWTFSFWFSWVESMPAVVDGVIYLGGSDFARVTALDPATGNKRWSTVVHGLTWGTPLVTTNTVYAGASAQRGAILPHDGGLVALDRRTGAVKWRRVMPLATGAERSGYLGSLVQAGDLIIGAAFDGTLSAFPIE